MKKLYQGFVIPLLIAIVALLGIGSGIYVYINNKSADKLQESTKDVLKTPTTTDIISQTQKPLKESTTVNKISTTTPKTMDNGLVSTEIIQLTSGTRTLTKTATSTTTTMTGNDGSYSKITMSKEEENYIKNNTVYGCGNESCFIQNFKQCLSDNVSTKIADFFMSSVYYEIKNKTLDGCNILFKYTESPNLDWVNKEMICTANNKLDFKSAMTDMFSLALSGNIICEGPLYKIFHP